MKRKSLVCFRPASAARPDVPEHRNKIVPTKSAPAQPRQIRRAKIDFLMCVPQWEKPHCQVRVKLGRRQSKENSKILHPKSSADDHARFLSCHESCASGTASWHGGLSTLNCLLS